MWLQISIGMVLGLLLGAGLYWLWKAFQLKNLKHSLGSELLLVKIPKEITKDAQPRDLNTEVGRFEQFLSNLASLRQAVSLEVAVPHVGEEIFFYLSVPKKYAEVASRQIQSVWNGASVERASDDYNIFNSHGASSAAYLKQKDNFAIPVRTYAEMEADTAGVILGGFAKVSELGEGAAMQVLLRPAPRSASKAVRHSLDLLKQGYSLSDIAGADLWDTVKGAFNPKVKKQDPEVPKIIDEEAVRALTSKLTKPLFEVNVRLVASAPSPFQANNVLEGIAGGFEQFVSPTKNDLRVIQPRNSQKLVYKFIFREFDKNEVMILSSEELASLYHFPTSFTETPKVKWLKSREAAPPPNMPVTGTLLGESLFRGERKNVFITEEDRRRHVYVIGQTGTGKSNFISGMIAEDIRKGKGVAVVDPHGELVEAVLAQIPKERAEDVIVFDPGDLSHPLGMNMLDYNHDRPEERTFIVNEMQSIFNKLFPPETMGPMFEQYMRNALLLLMEDAPNEPATLMEVPRVFTDTDYRNRKLARIHNAVVLDFWQKEASKAGGEASLANMTPYITSKFNNFISNDYMRPIIGQARSAFNFREIMDSRKILLVNLSKGKIGDINAGLLGMVITGKILMAALSRVDTADKSKLPDFCLYVDEFQNFATDSIATILSEARKYGLCLTMAHQFIAQLTEKIRDAVFGNVGTQVVFRVGAQDADFLVKQFEPIFNETDLMSIDNYNAHVKLLIQGQTAKPFNMHAFPLPPGNYELAEHLKEYSRLKYGVPRIRVEEDINRRLRN